MIHIVNVQNVSEIDLGSMFSDINAFEIDFGNIKNVSQASVLIETNL